MEFSFSKKPSQSFKPSGIHEKYLEDSSQVTPSYSLPHEAQSEAFSYSAACKPVRSVTSQPVSFGGKRPKQQKAATKYSPSDLQIDPIRAGHNTLQVDSQRLLQVMNPLRQMMASESDTGVVFSNLGMKQPKALGKGRTERDFNFVKAYLESGELPE